LIEREGEFTGRHIVLTEQKESTFGLLVDEVTEVLRVPEKSVKATPELITKKINANYLKGVATYEDRLIILLDLIKILAEEELAKVDAEVGKLHVKPEGKKEKPLKEEQKQEEKVEEKTAEEPEKEQKEAEPKKKSKKKQKKSSEEK